MLAQSDESREILHDAARDYLIDALQVDPRSVQRYEAFLTQSGAQKRNPANAFADLEPVKVVIKGDWFVGGRDEEGYVKENAEWWAEIEDPAAFFSLALSDLDAAFQMVLDENGYPDATVDLISEVRFE